MIQKAIKTVITYRMAIVMAFVLIALASFLSIKTAKIDAIPDIGENQQIVFTEWPGRSPRDVEEHLTYPLSIALQSVPRVKDVRALSSFGLSTIFIIFEEGVDFYWSRSRIVEALSRMKSSLPKDTHPALGPDATGLGQIFWYTVENKIGISEPLSLAQLRSLQDFYIKYHLQEVDGVSEVSSVGGFVKEYQIDVDPKKLFAYDIHFSDLLSSIRNSNIDVGAEVIEDGAREFVVRGKGLFRSLEDIKNVVIAIKDDVPIRVQDVASVGIGPSFRRGALDKNGVEQVGGVVSMRYGENPQDMISAIKKKLDIIAQGLPKGVEIVPFYDRSVLIKKSLKTVFTALGEEIVITIVVIFLFLLHFQSSLLISLVLPCGIGISFILMNVFNIDPNIMSLAGLVIAIGHMVDVGIIIIERIYSTLENHPSVSGREKKEKIAQAVASIGPAILTASMTTIITFLPVFGLTGSEGKLFAPLAWAKTLAVFGALITGFILLPALSSFSFQGLLRSREKNPLNLWILKTYGRILSIVLDHRKAFFILPAICIILGISIFTQLKKEFMPSLNEGDLLYMPVTTSSISMTKARELLAYTDKVLSEHPLVEDAVGKLGRVDSALDPAPISMFETVVKLIPEDKRPSGKTVYDIMDELDASLQIPGLINSWNFPIQTRLGMISTGIKTQVGLKIFGDDLGILEKLSLQIGEIVNNIEGAQGVYPERIMGKPYIEFDIDRVAASRFGINTGTVQQVLQTAVGGMPIGEFYEGRQRYPIRVRYKKELRDRIEELKRVLVPSPLGQHIPLKQLATIKTTTGPAAIQSENGLLKLTVLFNVKDRNLEDFITEAKKRIAEKVSLPKGYSLFWAGEYEDQQRAEKKLLVLIPLVLVINFIFIFWCLGSWRNSLIVMSAIPVGISGGLLLLWFWGLHLSVAVWVGHIALFGIVVDDGIVMMTYLQQITAKKKANSWEELKGQIVQAGSRRIRPLVMTTVTTVVALLPTVWSTSIGSEVIRPMAIPILGGMGIELITLFMVPVLYALFEEKKLQEKENHADSRY